MLDRDGLVWDWNTTKLSGNQLARKYGVTRGVVLGIIHRDPRSNQRRPPTPLQRANRRIAALEAEVRRLREERWP